MTGNPQTVTAGAPLTDAARLMRDADVGAVIVRDDGKGGGVVTDRGITVRATAFGHDPNSTPVREVCSTDLTTLSPDDDVSQAVQLMRSKNVRRLPGSRAASRSASSRLATSRSSATPTRRWATSARRRRTSSLPARHRPRRLSPPGGLWTTRTPPGRIG
jgi:CBS-domain-containing membrane protein